MRPASSPSHEGPYGLLPHPLPPAPLVPGSSQPKRQRHAAHTLIDQRDTDRPCGRRWALLQPLRAGSTLWTGHRETCEVLLAKLK